MDKQNKSIEMIEKLRIKLHQIVDERCDTILSRIQNGDETPADIDIPLCASPAAFKGEKPLAVIFPDGRCIPTPTWKKAVAEILRDCNANEQYHERMLQIVDKVNGRYRVIFGRNPSVMDMPLKIDDGMYFEGKFDTEYLIKMATERIFDKVGYDYSDIMVKIRPHYQQLDQEYEETTAEETEEAEDEEDCFPTLQM